MDILSIITNSSAKKAIIESLFRDELPELYLREIERLTGAQYKSLHTDILKLVEADLVQCRKDGNRKYFKANSAHPIFHELCSIVEKTSGITFLLGGLLRKESIEFAFVFGSMAKGTEKAHSDIDLFIIGKIGMRRLASILSPIEQNLGREINPHVYSIDEFKKKLLSQNHFICSIVKAEKNFIIGNEDEFRKVCKI